jgi:hypothetical protein
MTLTRTTAVSFAGGELTPEFFGQVGDAKFQTGLALCKDCIVLPHGPVTKRTGLEFIIAAKFPNSKTRFIPFVFSTEQYFALEFGVGYIRFHTQGGTLLDGGGNPYEVATPYLEKHLLELTYIQDTDVMTITHRNYEQRELKRLGALSWSLDVISFAAPLSPPASVTITPTQIAGDLATAWSSSKTYAPYDPVSVGGVNYFAKIASLNQTPPNATYWFVADPVTGEIKTRYDYLVTAVGDSTREESIRSSVVTTRNNLLLTGAQNSIAWAAVTGAIRYNVYKKSSGVYGYIGQTTDLSFIDENITADIAKTPPDFDNPFVGANNYPSAAGYYSERRYFAGTLNKPQNAWATKTGTESNLSTSFPSKDDDALSFRIRGRQLNIIRHIVPLNSLLFLTSGMEWRMNEDGTTPSSVGGKPQSYIGANYATPLVINNTVVFAAERGGHLFELGYSNEAGGYFPGDLCLRAPHLFNGFDIVDLAYAKAPYPIVWAISTSGKLLGLTYVPEQQIGAFHQHTTDGEFESICVIPEGDEDAVYVSVKRTINGNTVRYIERMHTRAFTDGKDAFYVDSGLTYQGAATTTISGLAHLEGKTVNILADGGVHPQRVVVGGSITLERAASTIHVGLPYTAQIQTLPLALNIAGYGSGRQKNINEVFIRVYRSSGMFAGRSFDSLTEAKQPNGTPQLLPPALRSDEIQIVVKGAWNPDGQLCIQQTDPLPMTICSLSMEVSVA